MKKRLLILMCLTLSGLTLNAADMQDCMEKNNGKDCLQWKTDKKVEVVKENNTTTQEVKQLTSDEIAKAEVLYKKCAACHGRKAEKKALNRSEVIQGWDSERIYTALKGYKDGTYGGSMKGLMKSKVKSLSADDIKLLSEYIVTLQD